MKIYSAVSVSALTPLVTWFADEWTILVVGLINLTSAVDGDPNKRITGTIEWSPDNIHWDTALQTFDVPAATAGSIKVEKSVGGYYRLSANTQSPFPTTTCQPFYGAVGTVSSHNHGL